MARVYTAANVILLLKIAVSAVTVLLAASLVALAWGRYKLHGRINIAVFVLTMTALLGLEVLARLISPTMFDEFFTATDTWAELRVHLAFAVPAALLLPAMLVSGLYRRRRYHIGLGIVFLVVWAGTFVTGVFFLPHTGP